MNEETSSKWVMFVDGSSNLRGSGVGIVLEGPGDLVLEYSLRFNFQTSNNQDECDALIARIKIAK